MTSPSEEENVFPKENVLSKSLHFPANSILLLDSGWFRWAAPQFYFQLTMRLKHFISTSSFPVLFLHKKASSVKFEPFPAHTILQQAPVAEKTAVITTAAITIDNEAEEAEKEVD